MYCGANVTYGLQFYESGYLQGDRRAIQRRMLATMTLVSLAISFLFWLSSLGSSDRRA